MNTFNTFDSNIKTSITIRDFLASKMGEENETTVVTMKNKNDEDMKNVNVVWDGGEYYVSYTVVDGETTTNKLDKLDNLLPVIFGTATKATDPEQTELEQQQ